MRVQRTGPNLARLGVAVAAVIVLAVAALTWVRVFSDDGGSAGAEIPRRRPDGAATANAPEPTSRPSPLAPRIGDADPACQGEADGTLTIGGLLPETGDLSFFHPAMAAATQVAVDDVNEAGGVLGRDVVYLPGDSGDAEPDVAGPTVERHLAAGADVILGAAASGLSLDVIDRITGACRIQFSPSATSPFLTDHDDDDLFFRTAPSDALQGQALADLMVGDGMASAAIVARDDPYGTSLLEFTQVAFERQGGEVPVVAPYDPAPERFEAAVATAVDAVTAADPDALVLIGFDESVDILAALAERGFTPDTHGIYLSDGNTGKPFGESFAGPGTLDGVKGTVPVADTDTYLVTPLLILDPALENFEYAAETYDAVAITALATIVAGTDDPAAVAREINGVTRDGELCQQVDECIELIATGVDIDYSGHAGPHEFTYPGEPGIADFTIYEFNADNILDPTRTRHHLTKFL